MSKPWDDVPDWDSKIPGLISTRERKMLWWMGQQCKSAIVEIGCFAGLSTSYLLMGGCEVHVFDRFNIVDDENAEIYAKTLGLEPGFRGSFRPIFERNIEQWKEQVFIHDKIERINEPISVLHIDASAGEAFHKELFETFYADIEVGGYLVHQDYCYYKSWYLPTLMSQLPAFRLIGFSDTSAVFQRVEGELGQFTSFNPHIHLDVMTKLRETDEARSQILMTQLIRWYKEQGKDQDALVIAAELNKHVAHQLVRDNLLNALS
jgi:hypothetical protein